MRQYEPMPVKRVVRGSDPMGIFWQVFYDWEWGGRRFSYGSPRMIENLIPEENYLEEVSGVVYQVIDHLIASQCAQVDIITIANGEWLVKIIKRDANGLYVEYVKNFVSFNEAVAWVKDMKYPVILGASYTVKGGS